MLVLARTAGASEPTDGQTTSLRPVVETLAAMALVSLAGWTSGLVGAGPSVFALGPALRPWALVTSVYAHATLGHLFANAVVVGLVGAVVVRSTTRARFHAFVLVTGVLSGVAQVFVTGVVGGPPAVLGTSGAAFALVGYVLAANPVSTAVVGRVGVSTRTGVLVVAAAALVVSLVASAPGSALVAHLVGTALGLVAGARRILL